LGRGLSDGSSHSAHELAPSKLLYRLGTSMQGRDGGGAITAQVIGVRNQYLVNIIRILLKSHNYIFVIYQIYK